MERIKDKMNSFDPIKSKIAAGLTVIEASAGVDGAVAREFGTFEALMQDAAGG
jgi:hypothetical protein